MEPAVNEIIVGHLDKLEDRLDVLYLEMLPLVQEIGRSLNALSALGMERKGRPAYECLRSMPVRLMTVNNPKTSAFPIQRMTIKQLVILALETAFPNGAGAAQLLDHFVQKWDRPDVIRSSLSPQLSRLRVEGKIIFSDGLWSIAGERLDKSSADEIGGGTPGNAN